MRKGALDTTEPPLTSHLLPLTLYFTIRTPTT